MCFNKFLNIFVTKVYRLYLYESKTYITKNKEINY